MMVSSSKYVVLVLLIIIHLSLFFYLPIDIPYNLILYPIPLYPILHFNFRYSFLVPFQLLIEKEYYTFLLVLGIYCNWYIKS